jgi:hypothetical protein
MSTVHLNPMAELAALMVQNDFLRGEIDDQNLRSAREAQQRALAREVHSMHEAADAIRDGAILEGSLAVAGSGVQCAGSFGQVGDTSDSPLSTWRAVESGGKALSDSAEPAGKLVGDVERTHAEARAREARGDGEAAEGRADEARQHRDRVERHRDAVLQLVESTLESEQQTNLAILGNV